MIKPFCFKDDVFLILDQRRLPGEEVWIECSNAQDVAQAIRTLAVRGAPAIGIAAAYGLVLEAGSGLDSLQEAFDVLVKARPTAVNLEWALRRVMKALGSSMGSDIYRTARTEADAIWQEEVRANEAMADFGAGLFADGKTYNILTHCNAGSLATGGMGTAIGVIRRLHEKGKLSMVYMDETRPLLQGARITAYEMKHDNIPCTLITDNMAGWLMKLGKIDAVIVGADRVAKNHDAANKIGTYTLAVLAHAHDLPFYIAAPESTFDNDTESGDRIVIEERSPEEVLGIQGLRVAPDVRVFNPAFDVTPSELITSIITESGIY